MPRPVSRRFSTPAGDPNLDPRSTAAGGSSGLMGVVLGLFGGFAVGGAIFAGCATTDPMLEAERELATLQSQPKGQAECRPGIIEPCYAGPDGTAGRGICKEGKRTCDPDGHWMECSGESLPKKELCNRTDDDCDGIVDNGFERAGAICFRGEGACKSKGTWACSQDGTKAECSAPIVKPTAEVCDGKDNDCDGEIDEGEMAGTGAACTTGKAGVCNAGSKRCVNGAIRCMQNKQPGIEICNKLDDNCNNEVDEDCISAEEARKAGK